MTKMEYICSMASLTRHSNLFALTMAVAVTVVSFIRFAVSEASGAETAPEWWNLIVSALILIITSLIIGITGRRMSIFKGYCTYPVVVFCVVASGICIPAAVLGSSIAAMLVALSLASVTEVMLRDRNLEYVFYWGLTMGAAACLNSVLIVLILAVIIIALYSELPFRKFTVASLGFVLPILAVGYVRWYMGCGFVQYLTEVTEPLLKGLSMPVVSWPLPVVASSLSSILALLALTGLVSVSLNTSRMLVKTRLTFAPVLVTSVVVVAAYAFLGTPDTLLPIFAVPLSLVISYALDSMKEKWANLTYWSLLILTAVRLFVD